MKQIKYFFYILGIFYIVGVNAMSSFTDFKQLKRPSSPNYYVVCPKDYCNIKPDVDSKTYPVSAETLHHLWLKSIKNEPRFKLLHSEKERLEYVQRSFVFRFPDYVSVYFLDVGNNESRIALLSRSKYGHSDFGVNKKRVKRLLKNLNKEVDEHVKK
jgi:uncharacterized protein (DUF1499 family)